MSEEKQYVTNFTFPNGETFYVKDEIIPDLDQASLGQVLTKTGENQLGWRTPSGGEGGGSGGAVDSVNGKIGVVVLDASDVGAYSKPSGGIPKSDLSSAAQTSLGKADTALQTAPVTSVNNKTGAVTLTASDVGALPSSTSIPTAVSELTNDSGYQTASDVQTAIAAAEELPSVTASDNGKFLRVVNGAWAVKSDEGGSSVTVDSALSTTSENPVQNKVVKAALDGKQNMLTAGQNVTISGNTISADVDSAEVAANVADWLDDNVTPVGSAVVVDSSLSVSGAAADAKATGDAIAKVYDDIGVNEPTPTPEVVVQPTGSVQGFVTADGEFASASSTKTFYFLGEPNTVYRMHVNNSVQDGVSQFIAEYPSIPSIGNVSANYDRINGREDVSITTGGTAGYICFGHGYESTDANMTVYAKSQSVGSKTLGERVADLETAVSEIDSGSAKTWDMELEFGSLNQSTVPNESKNLFTADNMTNGCDVSDSFTKFARTGFYYAAKKSISFNQDLIGCVYEYDADFAFIRVDLISSRTVELDENTRFVKVSVQPNATATSVTWSQGGFNGAATNRIVSNLIGVSTFDFVLMQESDSTLLIEFYDSNNSKIGNANGIKGMFINKTMILDRFNASVSGKTVNDVAYVKLSAKNAANTDIDTTYAPFAGLCSNSKLPKITVTTYAEKAVFKNKGVYGSTIQCVIPVTANDGHIYCTSILLRLPMNYSHIGVPSKLIFFKTGSDGYTNIRVSEFNYKDYLMYWVDSGYAVADCYGCTSKYPDMNPFGMPTNLCAYSAMWDFVKTHYNIDVDGFYLSCKSLGGMSANLMLANRNLPIRAAALFAPALINTKVCFGYYKNQRLAFIDDAGLEGDLSYIEQDGASIGSGSTVDYQNEAFKTIVKNNHDKLLGFLPLETGVVNKTLAELLDIDINTSGSMDGVIRYMQTPTRIWVAPDDTDTPYTGIESVVKSAQNGHSPVTIRTMPSGTGGHHSVDTASNAPKTNVTTRLGVTYSNFPIAYVEALQFLERY